MISGNLIIIKKKKEFSSWKMLILVFVFLASMNFKAKFFYFIFFSFFLSMIFQRFRLLLNKPAIALSLLSASLFVRDLLSGDGFNAVVKNLAFPLCYLLGVGMIVNQPAEKEEDEKIFQYIVLAVILGALTHVTLNMSINMDGTYSALDRNTIDYWSGESYSATGQASLFIVCIGVGIAAFFSDTPMRVKVCAGAMGVIVALYNLVLACRTPVVIALVVILIATGHLFIRKGYKGTKEKVAVIVAAVLLIVMFAYSTNLFAFRERIESSNLFLRILGSDGIRLSDSRLDIRFNYVKEIWFHPFGGSNLMNKYGYAHDFFFDTWDKAGVIAAISILYYVITTVVRLVKEIKYNMHSFFVVQLVLCVYVAHYIEFLVEPIIYGMPWLFSTFCLIDGAVSGLQSEYKRRNFATAEVETL